MKNLFAFLIIISISSYSFAQETAYHKALKTAISNLGKADGFKDLQNVNNQFTRIAQKKSAEWLPFYYIALTNANMSMRDRANADELAELAQTNLDKAKALVKDKKDLSELETLQGLIYTAKLLVDPMSRGQKYGMLSGAAYGKALAMDATNPRARLLQIQGQMGQAQFFKQDTAPFIEDAKTLLEKWDAFTPSSDLHPNWGKKSAIALANRGNEAAGKKVNISNNDFTISLKITKLRNDEGLVMVSLVNEKKEEIQSQNVTIKDRTAILKFENVKAGKYAIQYIHDENKDGELNSNFMGIPKEGYGFSNDARGFMGPPDFEDEIFTVSGDTLMLVKTKYH